MAVYSFQTEVAEICGVNAATIFHNIAHWVFKNETNGTNYHGEKYWTYNSIEAFRKQFSFLSDKQIRTALKKLEESGLIMTGEYNEKKFDRTKWYTLTDKGRDLSAWFV